MQKDDKRYLRLMIDEYVKRKHFFEVLRRWYVWMPLALMFLFIVDNPHFNFLKWVADFFKGILGQ